MKDARSVFFSQLSSKDAVKVVGIVCGAGLLLFGAASISGYDLSIGLTGVSCTKHDQVPNTLLLTK